MVAQRSHSANQSSTFCDALPQKVTGSCCRKDTRRLCRALSASPVALVTRLLLGIKVQGTIGTAPPPVQGGLTGRPGAGDRVKYDWWLRVSSGFSAARKTIARGGLRMVRLLSIVLIVFIIIIMSTSAHPGRSVMGVYTQHLCNERANTVTITENCNR